METWTLISHRPGQEGFLTSRKGMVFFFSGSWAKTKKVPLFCLFATQITSIFFLEGSANNMFPSVRFAFQEKYQDFFQQGPSFILCVFQQTKNQSREKKQISGKQQKKQRLSDLFLHVFAESFSLSFKPIANLGKSVVL